MNTPHDHRQLARAAARQYAAFPHVEAVALGGSRSTKANEASSDIDLYVYCAKPLPLRLRATVPAARGTRIELNNRFWEPSDEWYDAPSGIRMDVMMRPVRWIEERLDDVLVHHRASVGYTTCLWHNVRTSRVLFDRRGWFKGLQARARSPYPRPLVEAIVAKNYPILAQSISGYGVQIRQAVRRRDLVSLNHRVAAFLASYFDILFAVNRRTHPGEKRLVMLAERDCPLRPARMRDEVEALIRSVAGGADTVAILDSIMEHLDAILAPKRNFTKH